MALPPFAAGSSPPPASSPQPREPPQLKVEEMCYCYFHPGSALRVRTCEVRGLEADDATREVVGAPAGFGSWGARG